MVASLKIHNRGTRIKVAGDIVFVFSLYKAVTVCVDFSASGYCGIVRLIRIYKGKRRLTRNGIAIRVFVSSFIKSQGRKYPFMSEIAFKTEPFCKCNSTFFFIMTELE